MIEKVLQKTRSLATEMNQIILINAQVNIKRNTRVAQRRPFRSVDLESSDSTLYVDDIRGSRTSSW